MPLASIVCIQFYFENLRPLVNGIIVCGTGFGMVFWPPFFEFLVQRYSYKGATLIFGAIALNGLAIGALIDNSVAIDPEYQYPCGGNTLANCGCGQRNTEEENNVGLMGTISRILDLSLFQSPDFVLYLIGYLVQMAGYELLFAYLPDRAANDGHTPYEVKQGEIHLLLLLHF